GEMSVEGRPLEEKELIADAKNGDVSAYGQLVGLHQGVALRVAFLVVRDHAEAEDVTQEALVKAYRALSRFREEAPFRPWLLRIVRNEALNRLRSAERRERLALHLAADFVSGDAAPSPETEVMSDEERRRVLGAVEALPDRFRSVIAARFLVGLSEAETAGMLGIPTGTVKSRTSRGLDRLREMLGDRYE
ncbi:MAG: RNA polymerase sigma factor, partial [Acidimicrobiia bacterium]